MKNDELLDRCRRALEALVALGRLDLLTFTIALEERVRSPFHPASGEPSMIDLSEWQFASSHGLQVIGKTDKARLRTLSPVFEVLRPFSPAQLPNGQMTLTQQFLLRPFLSIPPGLRSLTLPEGSLFVSVELLGDRRQMEALLQNALDSDIQTRAVASGLVLPGGSH